jgi:hypothetical protein
VSNKIVVYLTSAKKGQFTHERVEYNVFLFDEPFKGSKSLKIFKISLTFRFDKLSNLSKSVHTGENSQILTVSNKKLFLLFTTEMTQTIRSQPLGFVNQQNRIEKTVIILLACKITIKKT